MIQLIEKTLSSGWEVRVRAVPPLASADVLDMSEYVHPPPPMQEVKTKVSTEYVSYAPNHPEMWEWRQECDKLDRKREKDTAAFLYYYGVHSWRLNGSKWMTQPPKDWEIDPALVKMLRDGDEFHRRLAFIKSELIMSPDDLEEIQRILYSIRPVKQADMDALEELFRNPVQLGAVIELLNQLKDEHQEQSLSGDGGG